MNSILVSAIHKSSGKTSVTLGLMAALTERGIAVQPFKKGPDYIDPMWLSRAAGHPCRNLDFHFMSNEEILNELALYGNDSNLCIIEGNKGLYDGIDVEGSDSNAALARLLGTPVVLVVDTRGMTRGIAPLIKGYCDFEPDIKIAGVILNQVGGSRHEGKLCAALERYTDVPVIGAIHRHEDMKITERHLGLIPANESGQVDEKIMAIAKIIESSVDVGMFGTYACTANPPEELRPYPLKTTPHPIDVKIGIAQDAAFGFYYPGDLEAFERAGAELVPFDTLHDQNLPEMDGLFIGGGFPETQAGQLSANLELRHQIRERLNKGMPAYAECGGLMYLSNSLSWNGDRHDMVGFIPGDAVMHERPVGRGYVLLKETASLPWPGSPKEETITPAHEFHYASLENLSPDTRFAYDVVRGAGITNAQDGIVLNNVVAGFSHQRNQQNNEWAQRFVGFVRSIKHAY